MTKNGLKKSEAATFLLDLVFQSQAYMVGTRSKDYLLQVFIKQQLLFHLQTNIKKTSMGWGLNLGPSDYHTKHYMTMATAALL